MLCCPLFSEIKELLKLSLLFSSIFLCSEQNDEFKEGYIFFYLKYSKAKTEDYELIFVDDFSMDDSIKLIEEYQKEDERIILIKQNKNKGTLICRNIGVINSRGKYIIMPDADDILSENILKTCYETATKNNIDMIRFNIYIGNESIFFD